jgi:phosphohistidine phosphatase SixA
MKRVYLLRHAKSSWKDGSLADRERPLAGRGRRAAKAVARHLEKAAREVPDRDTRDDRPAGRALERDQTR